MDSLKCRHTVKFVVGDWSGDGHGKTHEEMFLTNYSSEDIEAALYNIHKDYPKLNKIAEEYEEPVIPLEVYKLLQKWNIPPQLNLTYWNEHDNIEVDTFEDATEVSLFDCSEFIKLQLLIANVYLSDLRYEKITTPTIYLGGYGMLL